MNRVLFIESPKFDPDPAIVGANCVPLIVYDYRVGTPHWWDGWGSNEDRIAFLRHLPPGMRGVRCNWFGDYKLSDAENIDKTNALAKLLSDLGEPIDLLYLDNEDNPFRGDFLRQLVGMVSPYCKAVCNWNSCKAGQAWWGPYQGGVVGTHSCPQTYEMTSNANMGRWMKTFVLCNPAIWHGPHCEKREGKRYLGDEFGTQNVYARTMQSINYAASQGCRHFVYADYEIPDPIERERMRRYICDRLADADRVWPIEGDTNQ